MKVWAARATAARRRFYAVLSGRRRAGRAEASPRSWALSGGGGGDGVALRKSRHAKKRTLAVRRYVNAQARAHPLRLLVVVVFVAAARRVCAGERALDLTARRRETHTNAAADEARFFFLSAFRVFSLILGAPSLVGVAAAAVAATPVRQANERARKRRRRWRRQQQQRRRRRRQPRRRAGGLPAIGGDSDRESGANACAPLARARARTHTRVA